MLKNNIKKPFNIIINGRFLTRPVTGVERYAIELVKAIDVLIEKEIISSDLYSFTLVSPENIQNELKLKNIKLKKIGLLKGHLWEQLELPLYSGSSLLLNLCNTGPIVKRNQIVTIHDTSVYNFPMAYSFTFRFWYKILLRLLGKISQKVITVSSYSKKDLINYCKIKNSKIFITYEGKEHILSVESDKEVFKKHNIGNRPYILAVGSLNPNKNFSAIIRSVEIIGNGNFDVVIAGGISTKVFAKTKLAKNDFVKYIGYVSDGELRALYENSDCFVYPSFFEGFGLPPLEAMACGCPVIVSNSTSLPEVCGDAVLYCNPEDSEGLAEKILSLINNEALKDELKQKGLRQADKFTWEKCGQETLKIIEEQLMFQNKV